jgi:hypothetical protein
LIVSHGKKYDLLGDTPQNFGFWSLVCGAEIYRIIIAIPSSEIPFLDPRPFLGWGMTKGEKSVCGGVIPLLLIL